MLMLNVKTCCHSFVYSDSNRNRKITVKVSLIEDFEFEFNPATSLLIIEPQSHQYPRKTPMHKRTHCKPETVSSYSIKELNGL